MASPSRATPPCCSFSAATCTLLALRYSRNRTREELALTASVPCPWRHRLCQHRQSSRSCSRCSLQRCLQPATFWALICFTASRVSSACSNLTHPSCQTTSGTAARAATLGHIKIPTMSQSNQGKTPRSHHPQQRQQQVAREGATPPALTIQTEVPGQQLHHKDSVLRKSTGWCSKDPI